MATERLVMHRVREILRQKLVLRRSHRQVASAVGVSVGLVSSLVHRAAAMELGPEEIVDPRRYLRIAARAGLRGEEIPLPHEVAERIANGTLEAEDHNEAAELAALVEGALAAARVAGTRRPAADSADHATAP